MQASRSMTADEIALAAIKGKKSGRMAPKLAYRNLFHDRLSLLVTLIGIVFSVVLLAFQTGIYQGIEKTIAAVLDQTEGEIWIVPVGTKSIDDPTQLPGREKYAVLSTAGVRDAEPLMMGFSRWRKQNGGATRVLLVGSDWRNGGFKPWNIIEGDVDELFIPGAVAVDKTYFKDLDVTGVGDPTEINGQAAHVQVVTKGIRSFTTLPYAFTTFKQAQQMLRARENQSSYVLVKVEEGADVEQVRSDLAERLPDVEVLTRPEFRSRSINYWLFHTAAGSGLIAGTLLAIIVGIVIVAQTLYSSTKDHLNEFATLRALGASSSYIIQVILLQALLSGVVGYIIGMGLTLGIIQLAKGTTLNVVMTPGLAGILFLMTLAMCVIAAISAISKVVRIDPASVFSR